jgi:hypothetical protein
MGWHVKSGAKWQADSSGITYKMLNEPSDAKTECVATN